MLIPSTLDGYVNGRRLYPKGGKSGGDGGAGELRTQEFERRGRVQEAMNRIAGVFGGDVPGPAVAATAKNGQALFMKDGQLTTDAPFQAHHEPGQFGDDYFNNIADSFKKFQTPLLDEQSAEARRSLPFGFSSTASSAYLRKKGELERDIERQQAQLGDQALDFSNKQRGQVEQTRSDLVSLAQSGVDANAIAQMANSRASTLARPPVFSPIADLFQKYTALAANSPVARAQVAPLLFRQRGTGTSLGGGNEDAVRVIDT